MRYLALATLMCVPSMAGCVSETAEATPPSQPEAYIAARVEMDKMLAEKLDSQVEAAREGNTTLVEIRDAIQSLTSAMEVHTEELTEQQEALIADAVAETARAMEEAEEDKPEGERAPEPKSGEPPRSLTGGDGMVTLPDGRRVDPLQFISQHYRRPWTNPGHIRDHMINGDHGFKAEEIAGLDDSTLKRLHAAWHEVELTAPTATAPRAMTTRKVITQPRSSYYYPTYSSGGCPGGYCPAPTTRRRGLFGWR